MSREVFGDSARRRALRDAGLRAGQAVRGAVPGRAPRRHGRHGAAQPRAVHLRRRRPHGLREPRRAGGPGPGVRRGGGRATDGTRHRTPRRPGPTSHDDLVAVADLRRDISAAAGHPMVLRCCGGDGARRFAARPDLDVGVAGRPGHARPRAAHQAGAAGRPRRRAPTSRRTRPTSSGTGPGSATAGSSRSTPRPGSSSTPGSASWPPAGGWPTPSSRTTSTSTRPG